ncbi:MAG: formyltransferase family protein [Thermomicrobiales bacterium]
MGARNDSESWRIVLFTAGPNFIPLIEEWLGSRGHRLVGLVGAPGPRSRRTDDYLGVAQHARPGLDVVISNYPNRWANMIRPIRPDLIVCAGFNWKIPEDVLAIPRLGTINGHDSLLPKYRGRNASGWALRNDDPEYGTTVHYMSSEFDTGPILSQRRVPITDDDYNSATLIPRFVQAARSAFIEALDRVADGDPGTPQDESKAIHSGGAFEPEWREIDWSDTARQNFVKVRSWYGARDVPLGAFGEIEGRRSLITATKLTYQQSNHAAPGTVLNRRDDGTLLVQCGDGPLEILEYEAIDERTDG